jgi:hypothetical protein
MRVLKYQLMRIRILLLIMASALAASAQKVNIEFDPAVDFARFHTFAIRAGDLNSQNPALNSELTKKKIDFDIERGLSARGLVMVASGPSDLNVRYRLGVARKAEVEAYPAGWLGLGTRVVRVPFAEGTLVIDLRDPTTRSLVWRAISSEEKSDALKIEGKLDNMVKKSLDKYPPKR